MLIQEVLPPLDGCFANRAIIIIIIVYKIDKRLVQLRGEKTNAENNGEQDGTFSEIPSGASLPCNLVLGNTGPFVAFSMLCHIQSPIHCWNRLDWGSQNHR